MILKNIFEIVRLWAAGIPGHQASTLILSVSKRQFIIGLKSVEVSSRKKSTKIRFISQQKMLKLTKLTNRHSAKATNIIVKKSLRTTECSE